MKFGTVPFTEVLHVIRHLKKNAQLNYIFLSNMHALHELFYVLDPVIAKLFVFKQFLKCIL